MELHVLGQRTFNKGSDPFMKSYKNNPMPNKEVFVDGSWFRSGDLVRVDEDESVFILDRLKELIKIIGFQVPPADLEGVRENTAIFDAAAVGVKDGQKWERPIAFIQLHTGFKPDSENIMKFVNERVAPYKKIKEIIFLDTVPKNPSGKILRRLLV